MKPTARKVTIYTTMLITRAFSVPNLYTSGSVTPRSRAAMEKQAAAPPSASLSPSPITRLAATPSALSAAMPITPRT